MSAENMRLACTFRRGIWSYFNTNRHILVNIRDVVLHINLLVQRGLSKVVQMHPSKICAIAAIPFALNDGFSLYNIMCERLRVRQYKRDNKTIMTHYSDPFYTTQYLFSTIYQTIGGSIWARDSMCGPYSSLQHEYFWASEQRITCSRGLKTMLDMVVSCLLLSACRRVECLARWSWRGSSLGWKAPPWVTFGEVPFADIMMYQCDSILSVLFSETV